MSHQGLIPRCDILQPIVVETYHTKALFSLGMNILSVGWMLKASYQLSIIVTAIITFFITYFLLI